MDSLVSEQAPLSEEDKGDNDKVLLHDILMSRLDGCVALLGWWEEHELFSDFIMRNIPVFSTTALMRSSTFNARVSGVEEVNDYRPSADFIDYQDAFKVVSIDREYSAAERAVAWWLASRRAYRFIICQSASDTPREYCTQRASQ